VHSYLEEICGPMVIPIPLMLAIVLNECRPGSPDDVFACAVQLRNDPLVVRLREILHDYSTAHQELRLDAMARLNRILKEEFEQMVARFSGDIPSALQLELKPSWFPLEFSFDLRKTLKRLKDRDVYPALANLARLSLDTLRNLPTLRNKIERVLSVRLPGS
jgi:hypothetical protein